mgnify:CR=1 FL=1
MSATPAGTAMKDHDAHPVSPTGTETYKFNDLLDERNRFSSGITIIARITTAIKSSSRENPASLFSFFDDPASGFYVIDSRMIKGGVKEEAPGKGNPTDGLYVFSMKELNMQGSTRVAQLVVLLVKIRVRNTRSLQFCLDRRLHIAVREDAVHHRLPDLLRLHKGTVILVVTTKGNMGSGVMVDKQPCGNITRIVDAATGDEKINVNLFTTSCCGTLISELDTPRYCLPTRFKPKLVFKENLSLASGDPLPF